MAALHGSMQSILVSGQACLEDIFLGAIVSARLLLVASLYGYVFDGFFDWSG